MWEEDCCEVLMLWEVTMGLVVLLEEEDTYSPTMSPLATLLILLRRVTVGWSSLHVI